MKDPAAVFCLSIVWLCLFGCATAQDQSQVFASETVSLPTDTPGLLKVIAESPDMETRKRAIEALGNMKVMPDQALPVLIAKLDDEDVFLKAAAAAALGRYGERAKAALPKIIALSYERKLGGLRRDVFWSLVDIAPEDKKTADVLFRIFCEKEPAISDSAAAALVSFAGKSPKNRRLLKKYVYDVEKELKSNSQTQRVWAAILLAEIDPHNDSTLPILIKELDGDDLLISTQIVDTLGRMGSNARQAQPVLERLLIDADKKWADFDTSDIKTRIKSTLSQIQ